MKFNKTKDRTITDYFLKTDASKNNNKDKDIIQIPIKRSFYDLTEDSNFDDDIAEYEKKVNKTSGYINLKNKQYNNNSINNDNGSSSNDSETIDTQSNYIKSSSGFILPNKKNCNIENNCQNILPKSSQSSHTIEIPSCNKYNLTNKHQFKKTMPKFSSQENDIIVLDNLSDLPSPNDSSMKVIPKKLKIYPKISKPINRPVYNPEIVSNSYYIPADHVSNDSTILQSNPSRIIPATLKRATSLLPESNTNTVSEYLYNSSTTIVKSNPYGSTRFNSLPSLNRITSGDHITKSTTSSNKKPLTKTSRHHLSPEKILHDNGPELSPEQRRVLNMVLNERKSLFYTGSAGTGKSVLLREIIKSLKARHNKCVAVTASTGIAACNISGITLHSFAGIGLGSESLDNLKVKVMSNKKASERWRQTRVLIIDEISMVDGELFDKLEGLARAVRESNKPFGGIQLIITGDFFQLPPVNQHRDSIFAFEAKTWAKVINCTVMLTHVFRQKDQRFVDILNEMRVGKLSEAAIQLFKSLNRPLPESEIEPAELYPLRKQVEVSNNTRLEALKGNSKLFEAVDTGDKAKADWCIAPTSIQLKKHAQVMLLKNYDSKLVNGSLGIVVGFAGEGRFKSRDSIHNVLLRNRMNGRDKEKDLERNISDIITNRFPIVKFNDQEVVVERESWTIELPGGKEVASRSQIPLLLAWAMSIHKSQGQTLDRVRVDLDQIFEKGHAYVALSRATSLQSLQIINFQPSKVQAHPRVARFYGTLQVI